MNWELIWKALFIGLVAIFAVMSVLVTVLGAKDIQRLLRHLDDASNGDDQDGSTPT